MKNEQRKEKFEQSQESFAKSQDKFDAEKNASIEFILAQGLQKPQTTRARILDMIHSVGFRYIFWDIGYSLSFAAVTIAIVAVLYAVAWSDEYRYSASLAVAPIMFLLITAFAETSERACGLYELKQTCRFTVRQITALRVVCYSAAGAAFTAIIAVMGAKDTYDFLSLFPLCLSGLFICAALSLTVMRFARSKWANAVFSAVWMFVSVAPAFSPSTSLNKRWETLLSSIPAILSVTIAVIGAAIFIYQITKIFKEIEKHAYAQ